MRNITPRQFEEFIAKLLSELGFNDVILTPRSGDGGKDVIASHSVQGIPITFYFECKKYAEGNKIQLDTMRSLLGTVAHDSRKVNKGNFQGIHWAIVGGESGAKARPMKKEWVLNIKEQCNKQKIAFFFKQWGTWGEDNKKRSKKANGGKLDGRIWHNYPDK